MRDLTGSYVDGSLIIWASYVHVMTAGQSRSHDSDDSAERLASDAVDHVAATLRIAAALAGAGRRLDLSGLDVEIGKLCASLLDLPLSSGRRLRPRLVNLMAELDRLAASVESP